ncbi:MAG: hypothetical protein BWY19_00205 [bacterium ADurb.Bin212]|nr:MAG: hypothetical protein BWY19_00205 [bacterium ADurb.Bin212]
MEPKKDLNNSQFKLDSESLKSSDDSLISTKDCQKLFEKYDLDDKQVLLIRNSVIGIANSVINGYIDDYFEHNQ